MLGPCLGILGPCFYYFYNILASRCLKWLKFSLESHACHIEEYSLLTCLDHCGIIGTILGQCLGHIRAMLRLFLQYLCFQMNEMAQIFTGELCMPNRRIPFSVKLLGLYRGHIWAILGPCFGHFYNIFASRVQKWLKFSLERHACQIEEYHTMSNYCDHI